jgi:uncharacterized membrane protein
MSEWFSKVLKTTYYLSISYFTYLMVLVTLQYIPIGYDIAFLRIKQDEIALDYYKIAFFSHVYVSIFVLIAGIPQFSTYIRKQHSKLHKGLGGIYIFLILFIASPSGLVMGVHANGGFFSKLSFVLQAVLWFVFTLKAFQYAKQKNWTKHEQFMLRSYALTLSAISLRSFKWIITHTLELPPMDTYRIIAWLGWIFNILLVELYIYKTFSSKK